MAFRKGESGNPKGRPPKARGLSDILEKAGAAQVDINGDKVSGKKLLARLLWQGALTGAVEMPGGVIMVLQSDQWLGLVKFIYAQVDGPPKQDVGVEFNSDSGFIPVKVVDYRNGIAALAPGSISDSDSPG